MNTFDINKRILCIYCPHSLGCVTQGFRPLSVTATFDSDVHRVCTIGGPEVEYFMGRSPQVSIRCDHGAETLLINPQTCIFDMLREEYDLVCNG